MYPGSTEMQYVFQAKKVQTNYILLARGTILCTCRVPPLYIVLNVDVSSM